MASFLEAVAEKINGGVQRGAPKKLHALLRRRGFRYDYASVSKWFRRSKGGEPNREVRPALVKILGLNSEEKLMELFNSYGGKTSGESLNFRKDLNTAHRELIDKIKKDHFFDKGVLNVSDADAIRYILSMIEDGRLVPAPTQKLVDPSTPRRENFETPPREHEKSTNEIPQESSMSRKVAE